MAWESEQVLFHSRRVEWLPSRVRVPLVSRRPRIESRGIVRRSCAPHDEGMERMADCVTRGLWTLPSAGPALASASGDLAGSRTLANVVQVILDDVAKPTPTSAFASVPTSGTLSLDLLSGWKDADCKMEPPG